MEIPSNERQIIIYGAPGTGKSYFINQIIPKENQFRTTFHPDSDYSTFVGAYKPTMVGNDIQYKFVPQVFLKAYVQAYNVPEQNVYLVIEEINRGNCAQIFGDIFQLLDRDEKGCSVYEIDADEDIKAHLEEMLGKNSEGIKGGKLSLPSNLYIYATMNTSDQSLFPIDSAFKRRWYWVYSPIKYKNENKNEEWFIKIGDNQYSWTSFQKVVNDKIFAATNSEDKMLGDYFVKPNGNEISKEMFRDKILFYLWNDVCKDGSGDIFVDKDNHTITFSDLFKSDGDNKLLAIIEHLGVEKKSLENIEQGSDDSDAETNSGSSKRDLNQYSINGNGSYPKKRVLVEIIKSYMGNNPNISAEDFWDRWKFVYDEVASYAIIKDEDKKKSYQTEEILFGDKKFYINTQIWNPERMDKLKEALQKHPELGYSIEEIKQS